MFVFRNTTLNPLNVNPTKWSNTLNLSAVAVNYFRKKASS